MIPVRVEVAEQHKEAVKSALRPALGEPIQTATVTQGFRQGETILTFDADKGRGSQSQSSYENQR